MKKRIFGHLVLFVVLLGLVGVGQAEEITYVTLEEAQDIALENSKKIELAELGLQEAEARFRQAEASMIMQPNPTNLLQAQSGLDLARQNLMMEKEDLALEVRSDYFNVLKLRNMLEIAQEGLESARRHADVAAKKLEAGTATRLDVIKATRNVLNSQASVSQARHGLELAEMKFRQTLGLDLEAKVLPEEMPLGFDPVEVNLNEDIEFALANREEIKQLEAAVAVAEKNVELSDNEYTPAMTLEMARINLDKAKAQLAQTKQLLTLEIRQTYSSLQDAKERIPVLQKGVEEAEELIRLSELSYEANMITANDLQDAQISVLSAKSDLVTALVDYNLAVDRYFYAVAHALRD